MATHRTVQVGDIVDILLENPNKTRAKLECALVVAITGSTLSVQHTSMSANVNMDKATVILKGRQVKRFLVFHNSISSNIAYETAEEAHEAARQCYGNVYSVVPLEGQWCL